MTQQPPKAAPDAMRLFPGIGNHHNVMEVGNFMAAMSSAQFVIDHFAKARPFPTKNHIYGWAMEQAKDDGLVLEFGVASGGTINQIAGFHKGPVHGFDVFSGLPETWRPGFPEGAFAQAELPKVKKNVELVVGLFEDTLPGFVATHKERLKFLHVDCDIYSGTVTIFECLEDRIDDDTIIVFDEYFNFPGWETCEHQAFMEFCARTGREPEYLAFVPASEQVVARARKKTGKAALTENTGQTARATPTLPKEPAVETKLQHVQHADFDALKAAGHRIERFDDGVKPLSLSRLNIKTCPKNWRGTYDLIQPQAATVRQARLFIDGSFLTEEGLYSYEAATFNIQPWRKRHLRAVLRYVDEETDEALIKPTPRSLEVPGRCFSALSSTTHNYGHFVHDVLSRVYYETLGLIAPGRDKIIAPNFRFPMQKALFERVFAGYETVFVPHGTSLVVEELVSPVNLCDSTAFHPGALADLATRLRDSLADLAAPGTTHKVCVSRSDGKTSGGRDFVNMDAYEAHMRKRGYQVIAASGLSLEDQFRLWRNTGDIVGIHGAGMMNMIMMPEGRYTELTPNPQGPPYTFRCAAAAGHNAAGYNAAAGPAGQSQIDLKALDAILDRR